MTKKLKIVIYLVTQWIHGVGGAMWCSVDRQGLSVETVAAATVMLGRHNGMQATYIDCSLLVAADISQPIQKMVGIDWLRSADTNNLIFCIG
jgi:cbb3-type cytochrome oxidase subunit 1